MTFDTLYIKGFSFEQVHSACTTNGYDSKMQGVLKIPVLDDS